MRRYATHSATLLLATLVVILACIQTTEANARLQPAKRTYDTHTYYVLEIDSEASHVASPKEVALALGAEHVERVGELDDFYLIRAPTDLVARGHEGYEARGLLKRDERDAVLERFALLKRDGIAPLLRLRSRRLVQDDERHVRRTERSILSIERQYPRQRVKRDLPVLPPAHDSQRRLRSRDLSSLNRRQDTGIVQKMASMLGITDPLWSKQWHLVNGVILDNHINVTGVWQDKHFGEGVNVAIVDDGLDMHSDDLAPNFVSLYRGLFVSRAILLIENVAAR
jgi:kexin